MNKIMMFLCIFLLCSLSVSAVIYVADGKSLYRSLDDSTFTLAMQYQAFNGSLGTNQNVSNDVRNLETSYTGQYVGFIDGNLSDATVQTDRRLMLSHDYGYSWICYPNCVTPLQSRFYDYDLSYNGSVQALLDAISNKVLVSNDYGLNFVNKTLVGATSVADVSVSDSGKIIAVSGATIGSFCVWLSNNYGANFSRFDLEVVAGDFIFVCADDSEIYAGQQSTGGIFTTIDNGTNWNETGASPVNVVFDSRCKGNTLIIDNYTSTTGNGTLFFKIMNATTYVNTNRNLTKIMSTNGTAIYFSSPSNKTQLVSFKTGFTSTGNVAFSDTVFTPVPNISRCMDENTFCDNAVYNFATAQYECQYADTTYCDGGCVADVCTIFINSTCNIINSRRCFDSTTYAVCSDSNGDGALDFNETHACGVGEICFDSFNFASCVNVTSFGVHNPYSFTFFPYSVSNDGTVNSAIYSLNAQSRVLDVLTNKSMHVQQFYNNGAVYIARTCNYIETAQYTNNVVTELNATTSYIFSSPIATMNVLRINLLPDDLSNTTIDVSSILGVSNSEITIFRNASRKQLTIYQANGSIIYDDYDISTSDTLTELNLEYTFDFVTSYYSLRMTFNRNNDNVKIRYPLSFVGADIYNVTIFTNSGNISLHSITDVTIPQPNTWTETANQTAHIQNCVYTTQGNYKVRTYANAEVSPDYETYLDYTIALKMISSDTSMSNTGTAFGSDLSQTTKYILAFVTFLILIGAFTGVGFNMGNAQAGFVMGCISGAFALFIFVILGWIHAWLLIFLSLIAITAIVFVSRMPSNNAGGGGF